LVLDPEPTMPVVDTPEPTIPFLLIATTVLTRI